MFKIYIDPKQHCLNPRWYCKFMFWLYHGWVIRREFVSLKDLEVPASQMSNKK
jgi:hypothetical protein